jgi:hypothetical protein
LEWPCAGIKATGGPGYALDLPVVQILLATGDRLAIDASMDDVIKELENAARSSAGTLARLTEAESGEPVAVNAAHVVLVRSSDT